MEEEHLKKINMNSSGPEIRLPPPVLSEDGDGVDDDDDMSFVSSHSEASSTSTMSSSPLSISIASLSLAKGNHTPKPSSHTHPSMEHASQQIRCHCVHEMKEAFVQKDDATVDSDLDSNAFYWQPSPPLMRKEYSLALDKAVEKKSPRLAEILGELHVDDEAVKIAVKELLTSHDKVSHVLKRMHEGMASKDVDKKAKVLSIEKKEVRSNSFTDTLNHAAVQGGDLKILRKLVGKKMGYFWKNDALWGYSLEIYHSIADVECAKMDVLEKLLEQSVESYDHKYTYLRKLLRDVVTSGDYRLPLSTKVKSEDGDPLAAQPIFKSLTPLDWIFSHKNMHYSRLNVKSLLKDSRLGVMEHEPQYFVEQGKALTFLKVFSDFVGPIEKDIAAFSRHFTFGLKRSDDILARFYETHPQSEDFMLIVHGLCVLLAKQCILLRMWVNFALPHLGMWLALIEKMEMTTERRLISPFFPPPSRKALYQQLTNLGIFDEETMNLVQFHDHDVFGEEERQEEAEEEAEEYEVAHPSENQDLRFSKIFTSIFSSSR